MRKLINLIIIFTGFIAVIAQAMLFRELVMQFCGNEFSLGIMFSSWLFWTGMGSIITAKFIDKIKDKFPAYVYSIVVVVLLILLDTFLIKIMRLVFNVSPGELWPMGKIFLASFLTFSLPCFVIGSQFVFAYILFMQYEGENTAVNRAYRYEAIGNIIGGFIFAYFLVNMFIAQETANILIMLTLVVLAIGYWFTKKKNILLIACVILVFCVLFWTNRSTISFKAEQFNWQGFKLVETANSRYANFSVIEQNNQRSLYASGELSLTFGDKINAEELAHFPMLQQDSAKRVLVVGGAVNGVLQELLKYPVEEIYYLELDNKLIDLARKYIDNGDKIALNSPRVKILNIDARLFINQYKKEKFDVIILNIASPQTIEANRFYTVEFYRILSAGLNDKGIVFFGIRSNEDYLGKEMQEFNASVYHTLKQVFPYIELIPGETMYLLSAKTDNVLTSNVAQMADRLKRFAVSPRFINEHTLPYRFDPRRRDYIKNILINGNFRINHDFYPVSFYYMLLLWGAQFQSLWPKIFAWFLSVNFIAFLLIALLVLAVWLNALRSRRKKCLEISVFNMGFCAIILQLVLITAFQILSGYIYHLLGLIVAAFMLGLVIGSLFINKQMQDAVKNARVLFLTQAGLSVYALLLPAVFYLSAKLSLNIYIASIVFVLLSIANGVFVGIIFPAANSLYIKEEGANLTGRLYALDLAGASIGALAGALFFVPAFGINKTCILVAVFTMTVAIFTYRRKGAKN